MTQYISKSALVAKIKGRIKTNKECMLGLRHLEYYQGKVDALNDTISSLDTLEVKEVDLEEEIERVRKTHFINDDFEKAALEGRQITNIAKHFFELGISVSNKAQKGE